MTENQKLGFVFDMNDRCLEHIGAHFRDKDPNCQHPAEVFSLIQGAFWAGASAIAEAIQMENIESPDSSNEIFDLCQCAIAKYKLNQSTK